MQRRHFLSGGLLAGLSIAELPQCFAQLTNNDKPKAITNKIKRWPLKPFYVPPDTSLPDVVKGVKPVPTIPFAATGNQFSAVEITIAPKTMGPAPHVHKELDEYMRVITGTVTVMVENEVAEIKEGGWHLRPHGMIHTFWNAGDEPAKFIDIYPNQNFDLFIKEMLKLFNDLQKEGISHSAKEAERRLDLLHQEWGIVMYHNQREALRMKYRLT